MQPSPFTASTPRTQIPRSSSRHSSSPGREAQPLFESVFLGGFECSSHRLADGKRLDMLSATRHDELAALDYARLRSAKMTACRDGVAWVHAERRAGVYDFSRFRRMARAAEGAGVAVVWDLMHFGWPDDVDIFGPRFSTRFARYARAFARTYVESTDQPLFVTPVNEMSFFAWAAGDVRCMYPFEAARGVELKSQLVRATIEAIEAIRDVMPAARFLQPEPVIRIHAAPDQPKTWARVESDNLLQFQAWDMLTGRVWPSLGGDEKYLDVIGVNFYSDNQFTPSGETVFRGDERYVPFSTMLLDVHERYKRPMIVSETGAEGPARAPWLRYVADQCANALRDGCELHAITLYPVLNHPGWADERHCHNGLWDYADGSGGRSADPALLREIVVQDRILTAERAAMLETQ